MNDKDKMQWLEQRVMSLEHRLQELEDLIIIPADEYTRMESKLVHLLEIQPQRKEKSDNDNKEETTTIGDTTC